MQRRLSVLLLVLALAAGAGLSSAEEPSIREYRVPAGSHPHDVAPAPDGSVWYTAQNAGALGRLDPATGSTRHISLGPGSSPHGVIVGPDGAPWVTDSGRNAIIRVDPSTEKISVHPLPKERGGANLNTAAFDGRGSSGSPAKTASTGDSIRARGGSMSSTLPGAEGLTA